MLITENAGYWLHRTFYYKAKKRIRKLNPDLVAKVKETLEAHLATSLRIFSPGPTVIRNWIRYYNTERPHSALGYVSPRTFLQAA